MLTQMLLGAAMIVITTFIQGLYTVYGIERLRDHLRLHPTKSIPRALSSFEAANGLLLFGWSTALLFVAVKWVYQSDV
jgi:hypothetical protein